ncbi:CMRF35-like molecule 3 isoform X1 [Ambystoma mexicanum]|uniref:CMRF35-like molecule 3 isoform X1 n=1 Tax=Ambystoma mexicanum TaxID=8296 RepID=UPI0037E8C5EE
MRAFILWVFLLYPASGQDVSGPAEVAGEVGGSLTVVCSYDNRYETDSKYWCRGSGRSCDVIIRTSGSEVVVSKDRVSILDDRRAQTFRVTMKALTLGDAGPYECGIDTFGYDPLSPVTVTVLSASSTFWPSTVTSTVTMKTTLSIPADTPARLPPTSPSASPPTSQFTSTSTIARHGNTEPSGWILQYLLPAVGALLLLLLLAAVLLIRAQRRKKAPGKTSAQNGDSQNLVALRMPLHIVENTMYAEVICSASQSAGSSSIPEVCYADLKDSMQDAGQVDITYSTIQFGTSAQQQEEVYANMGRIHMDPSLECSYSSVRVEKRAPVP